MLLVISLKENQFLEVQNLRQFIMVLSTVLSLQKIETSLTATLIKYAPQYGGFCAYGMTFGKKFEIDGKAFKVVDGKLYVNKNQSVFNAWAKDIPQFIQEANEQWPNVETLNPSDL